MTSRDAKLMQYVERYRHAQRKQRRLIHGQARAYLVRLYGNDGISGRQLIAELMQEFDDYAHR